MLLLSPSYLELFSGENPLGREYLKVYARIKSNFQKVFDKRYPLRCSIVFLKKGRVAELVDASDSKSDDSNVMRVRFSLCPLFITTFIVTSLLYLESVV